MSSGKNGHIFIVDDDDDDREFIMNALSRNGFQGELAEFENGQFLFDYLNAYPNNKPDLILLDLNMPVKNGFETLRELKQNEGRNQIPVVIFSASTRKEDEQYCLKEGCSYFLSKPLNMEGYNDIARFVRSQFF